MILLTSVLMQMSADQTAVQVHAKSTSVGEN